MKAITVVFISKKLSNKKRNIKYNQNSFSNYFVLSNIFKVAVIEDTVYGTKQVTIILSNIQL